MDEVDDDNYIYFRQPDGSLKPSTTQARYKTPPCAVHHEYDAGINGRCVRCYEKIAPRTILIIEPAESGR
jgi:hypothetical protein